MIGISLRKRDIIACRSASEVSLGTEIAPGMWLTWYCLVGRASISRIAPDSSRGFTSDHLTMRIGPAAKGAVPSTGGKTLLVMVAPGTGLAKGAAPAGQNETERVSFK